MKLRTELVLPLTVAAAVMVCGIFGPRTVASLDSDSISALANILLLVVTTAGVVIAASAVSTWKEQLHGTSQHAAAREIAIAAEGFRYEFYAARSPMFWAWEFPHQQDAPSPDPGRDWEGYAHIYLNRRKQLWIHVETLAKLRATAAAVLGRPTADAVDALARMAIKLQSYQESDVEQRKVGPQVVALWTDQDWVRRVRESVIAHDTPNATDSFSLEFEGKLENLKQLLRPHNAAI
jgi:hypothetical protein